MTDFDKLINSQNAGDAEKALNAGVRSLLDKQLRKELDADIKKQLQDSNVREERPVKKLFPLKWLSIAASFLVLVVASYWWLNKADQVSPQQFAMADIIQHPGVSKGSDEGMAMRTTAIEAFNNQKWQDAITAWSAADPSLDETRYYLALSYFYNGNYREANARFKMLSDHENVYTQEVKWFYGLSLLLNGETSRGEALLATIHLGEWHYDEAQSLLTAHR